MQELVPESKSEQNKTIFSTITLTVGSSAECDISIFDPTISAKHLSISYLGKGCYRIIDLDSDMGTFFTGKKIKDQTVRLSDVIQIGYRPVEVRWLSTFFNKGGFLCFDGFNVIMSSYFCTLVRVVCFEPYSGKASGFKI